VVTNIPMLIEVLQHEAFIAAEIHTGWLDATYGASAPGLGSAPAEVALQVLAAVGPGGPLAMAQAAGKASDGPKFADPWLDLAGMRIGGAG
jgi:hypothetical protein